MRRGGFNDSLKVKVDLPGNDGAATARETEANSIGDPPAPRGAMSARLTQPEISPLRLDRLKKLPPPEEPQIVAAAAQRQRRGRRARLGASLRLTLRPLHSACNPHAARQSSAPAEGKTPRQKRPSIDKASSSAGAPAALVPLTEEVAAPSAAAAPSSSSDAIALCEDDATLASACGELRAFYLRGPPLPPLEAPPSVAPPAGGGGTTRRGSAMLAAPPRTSSLPRSFWEACTPLTDPTATISSSNTVCWPADSELPNHLRFFCFPESLMSAYVPSLQAGGQPDGFGFTFSFTSGDGSVRWGCAVTGCAEAESAQSAGAVTTVSVCLIGDWPLLGPMLDACKQLFRSEQRHRTTLLDLATQLRPLATSLAASAAEVTFLLQHPLWLPTPLAPLIDASSYQAEIVLYVFLASLLERPLLLCSSVVAKLMPAAAALAHTLSPLSFSATFIPFLPLALHPEPATLVNCSPAPYIIGIERLALPALQPLASHVLLFDLDEGTVQGEEVLDELKALYRAANRKAQGRAFKSSVQSTRAVAATAAMATSATEAAATRRLTERVRGVCKAYYYHSCAICSAQRPKRRHDYPGATRVTLSVPTSALRHVSSLRTYYARRAI